MNKKAFTLAEVLITLGIIGIVAAMTLPVLTGKYQHKVLESQFKKAYANIQTAINTVNSENGIPYECYTLVNGNGYNVEQCDIFWPKVLEQYKSSKLCEAEDYSCRPYYKTKEEVLSAGGTIKNQSCSHPMGIMQGYNLNDGSTIYLYKDPNGKGFKTSGALYFGIDVNGMKGPNKWGYDLFYLNLYKKNERAAVLGLTAVCELIEKGGQSAEDVMLK